MVGIVGAGNVGQALAWRLHALGFSVVLLKRPYQALEAPFAVTSSWEGFPWSGLEGVFLCVRDAQLPTVAAQIAPRLPPKVPVFHTAGSVELAVLEPFFGSQAGVVYPLQSFSVGRPVEWGKFFVFWEGALAARTWAERLTQDASKVRFADSETRLRLHVGAVFTANFVNALFHMAEAILPAPFSREVYLPLTQEVLSKLEVLSPEKAQTGPARRGDQETLAKHLALLQKTAPSLAPLYQHLSQYIQAYMAQSSVQ
ncbi:MAG: DUF2520 domain-containing protein [Bacteroidetes bacterium]|nr:MAG: DUF2520 domain-containing protein [Bacteroidota bacterium]